MNLKHITYLCALAFIPVAAPPLGCDLTEKNIGEEPGAPADDDGDNDASCTPDDVQPADDGCNTCYCQEDGTWACTEIACPDSDSDSDSDSEPGDPTDPGMGCTQIGCNDGFFIDVTPHEAWPHGEYRFEVTLDDELVTCTGSLPLPGCETRGLSCDGEGVQIIESGCALDASLHAFGDIYLDTLPETVSVRISHDDAPLGGGDWTPEYQTLQPNGPGCEPICTQASGSIELDF